MVNLHEVLFVALTRRSPFEDEIESMSSRSDARGQSFMNNIAIEWSMTHDAVALLGIFPHLLAHCQRVYRKSPELWPLGAASAGSAWIPDVLFNLYRLIFACATAELAIGGAMERGALGPSLLFVFIWTTIVYDPIACWTWNPNGWLFQLGGLDFTGGGSFAFDVF